MYINFTKLAEDNEVTKYLAQCSKEIEEWFSHRIEGQQSTNDFEDGVKQGLSDSRDKVRDIYRFK